MSIQRSKPSSGGPLGREIADVRATNVDDLGFFCYMSKKKSEGYARKRRWLEDRFAEGLGMKMLVLPERGFIEFIPGEYAWRAVRADGYLVIHCLWVVGRSKGCGFGLKLLDACIAEARRSKLKGVAMATSEKIWLAGRRVLERRGFVPADEAPPSFSLMVLNFGKHPPPSFAGGWEEKARACGRGLTVIRSDQCPYLVDATNLAVQTADKAGIKSRVVELQNRADLLRFSPTPYGVFGLVLDGKLLSDHYLLEKDLLPLLKSRPYPTA